MNTKPAVTEAVVLMAGMGSRLRSNGDGPTKPLTLLLGRPLASYILEELAAAGIRKVCAIVGFESERVIEQVTPLIPEGLTVEFVLNPEYQKQNGISVLAARGRVRSPFVLTMSDHLYDEALLADFIAEAQPDTVNLAIDRKIRSIYDLDDAMKVVTEGERITAIGKSLTAYDAIDTGLFVCSENLFDYLERARKSDDCSLADGVRLAASDNKARAVDIGDAWWQDVDTREMLAHAEERLRAGFGRGSAREVKAAAGDNGPKV